MSEFPAPLEEALNELHIIGCTGSMSGPDSPGIVLPASSSQLMKNWEAANLERVLDMGPGSFGELWRYIEPTNIVCLLALPRGPHGDVISLRLTGARGPGAIVIWFLRGRRAYQAVFARWCRRRRPRQSSFQELSDIDLDPGSFTVS